jgi:hypothetical protein
MCFQIFSHRRLLTYFSHNPLLVYIQTINRTCKYPVALQNTLPVHKTQDLQDEVFIPLLPSKVVIALLAHGERQLIRSLYSLSSIAATRVVALSTVLDRHGIRAIYTL